MTIEAPPQTVTVCLLIRAYVCVHVGRAVCEGVCVQVPVCVRISFLKFIYLFKCFAFNLQTHSTIQPFVVVDFVVKTIHNFSNLSPTTCLQRRQSGALKKYPSVR